MSKVNPSIGRKYPSFIDFNLQRCACKAPIFTDNLTIFCWQILIFIRQISRRSQRDFRITFSRIQLVFCVPWVGCEHQMIIINNSHSVQVECVANSWSNYMYRHWAFIHGSHHQADMEKFDNKTNGKWKFLLLIIMCYELWVMCYVLCVMGHG